MRDEEKWAKRLQEWQDQANEIEARVPGFEFIRHEDGRPAFGGSYPWQADAHLQGQYTYLRFRHNQASMTVYDKTPESLYTHEDITEVLSSVIWPYYPEGHPEHHVHTGAPLDEDIAEMITLLIHRLAPVSEDNPSSMMILGRAVDALVEAEKRGKIRWTVGGRPLDDVLAERDPDKHQLP